MMSTEKVGVFAVITNEQGSELVNPGKTAFTGETLLVDRRVEEAFTPAFSLFAVALVLTKIGDDPMIEANLPSFQRIKSAVRIEVSASNRQSQALHLLESSLQVRLEVEGIMMVARDHPGGSQDIALRVGDGQNIRGFGAFSVLVSDTFAAFLGYRVTPVEVQLGQIEVFSNHLHALLPDPL